jgi:hypothetical protein
MNLSSMIRQRTGQEPIKLLVEFLVGGACVFIAMLLLLQVGSNAKALTAMRQDQRTEVAVAVAVAVDAVYHE